MDILLSGSQDGQLVFWKFSKQEKLDDFKLQEPIFDIFVPSVDKSELILVLGKNIKNDQKSSYGKEEVYQKSKYEENVMKYMQSRLLIIPLYFSERKTGI